MSLDSHRIELVKGKGLLGKWFYRVRAPNGETMYHSESYYSKWNAKRAAEAEAERQGIPLTVVKRWPQ